MLSPNIVQQLMTKKAEYIFGEIYMKHYSRNQSTIFKRTILLFTLLFTSGILLSACSDSEPDASNTEHTQSSSTQKHSNHKKVNKKREYKKANHKKSQPIHHSNAGTITNSLVKLTNAESAGNTGDYYYENGAAKLTNFSELSAGTYKYSSDSQGRSSTARAVLTYGEYRSSMGSRQGDPLAPPSWPDDNPKVAISYSSTGRTYHGYLYNRSHSIGDSLLGTKSYTSLYNFTTGTRPQNVGADQNGGMRYAEETVENYWQSHSDGSTTVDYQVTPVYYKNENIPRGTIVDIKSSDNQINKEIVVINSAEGIKINYNDGSNNAKPIPSTPTHRSYQASNNNQSQTNTTSNNSSESSSVPSSNSTNYDRVGNWSVAHQGMVFVSDSDKYYKRVTNPENYQYESQGQAEASGASVAARGNQYARPN